MLCYLLWFMSGIILLSAERKNRFVRFHALQSILYSTAVTVVLLAFALAQFYVVVGILGLAAVVIWLFLMYRAAHGRWYELPLLGSLAERSA